MDQNRCKGQDDERIALLSSSVSVYSLPVNRRMGYMLRMAIISVELFRVVF